MLCEPEFDGPEAGLRERQKLEASLAQEVKQDDFAQPANIKSELSKLAKASCVRFKVMSYCPFC